MSDGYRRKGWSHGVADMLNLKIFNGTLPFEIPMAFRPMSPMKKSLIAIGAFFFLTILAPIVAWVVFDLEGTDIAGYFGYMIFIGVALGGWLAWTLIANAFFRH